MPFQLDLDLELRGETRLDPPHEGLVEDVDEAETDEDLSLLEPNLDIRDPCRAILAGDLGADGEEERDEGREEEDRETAPVHGMSGLYHSRNGMMSAMSAAGYRRVLASHRKARHEYDILDQWEAGLILRGTEVKSAREGNVQLRDGYVELRDGEAWLVGVYIAPYSHGNRENHDPERARKLLLGRRELDRLAGKVHEKGLTLIPLELAVVGDWIKVRIALARGRQLHDKRRALREKEMDREAREALSRRN